MHASSCAGGCQDVLQRGRQRAKASQTGLPLCKQNFLQHLRQRRLQDHGVSGRHVGQGAGVEAVGLGVGVEVARTGGGVVVQACGEGGACGCIGREACFVPACASCKPQPACKALPL